MKVKEEDKLLNEKSDQELLEVYEQEQSITSLRIIYTRNKENLNLLSEEMLIVLLQNGYDVKKYLFQLVKNKNYDAKDESLVIMAQEGDVEAKKVISLRYVKPVKKIVMVLKKKGRYIRGDDDDDLIQSGYLGFFKAIRDFKIEKKSPFKAFVQHVIKRYIDNIIGRSGNNKLRTLNDACSYNSPVGKSDAESTFEHFLSSEEFQPMHHILVEENFWELWDTFSETERYVCWYYAEDYSYEEIGKIVFKDTHPTTEAQVKAVDNSMQRIKVKREAFVEGLKKAKW